MTRQKRLPVPPPRLPRLSRLDRLRWLVEIANTTSEEVEVAAADPRKLGVAVRELRRYIFDDEPTGYPELSEKGAARHLNQAFAVVRRIVATVADRELEVFPFGKGQLTLDARKGGYQPVVYLKVPLRDRLLHLALEDVRSDSAVSRIRRCPELACEHRLYFSTRTDQRYCSRACSSRGSSRDVYYKKNPKAKRRPAGPTPSGQCRNPLDQGGSIR